MRQGRFVGSIVAFVIFIFLIVLMPVNVHAGICGTTPCVDSADIINGQVTGQDISSTVMMPGSRIVDESVTGADIKNGSLTGTDIQDGSIGSADITNGAVGSNQINNTQVQGRVTGTCATGSSIRTVNQDGTVVCEADDNTSYTSGTGINISGNSINISNSGVGSMQISDGAVTSAKIGPGAVGSSQIANGGVTSTNIAPLSIGTAHLIDGNVTTAKIMNSAVGSTQISDGSITSADVGFNYAGSASKGGAASDLSCIGCVSQTELNFGGVKPAQRIVVAESGGDYTSISAALAAILPSASNPYVIDVMPGVYIENITMKSYVHLRGAGQNVTIIQSPNISNDVITISNLREVIISGLTIKNGRRGIYHAQAVVHIPSSSVVIEDNLITENIWTGLENAFGVTNTKTMIRNNNIIGNSNHGIRNSTNSSDLTIVGNLISANSWSGIYNISSNPTITNNIITDNTQYGIYVGTGSSALIKENTIKFNGMYGTYNATDAVSYKVIHNWITDNGGITYADVYCDALTLGGENVSFNVINTRSNNGVCSGNFNVTNSGSTW